VRYFIDQGLLRPLIEVDLDPPPPCMDGPLVCAWCDCGSNRDGSRWTSAQNLARHAHWITKVAEYRERAPTTPKGTR
jgi:hypothetical protein